MSKLVQWSNSPLESQQPPKYSHDFQPTGFRRVAFEYMDNIGSHINTPQRGSNWKAFIALFIITDGFRSLHDKIITYNKNSIIIRSAKDGNLLFEKSDFTEIARIKASKNEKFLFVFDLDRESTISVIDLIENKLASDIRRPDTVFTFPHDSQILYKDRYLIYEELNRLSIYDIWKGSLLYVIDFKDLDRNGCVDSYTFNSDGKLFCAGGIFTHGYELRCHDIRSGQQIESFKLEESVTCLKYHEDRNELYIGFSNGVIKIWTLFPQRKIGELKSHVKQINHIEFFHRNILYSGSSDGLISWNLDTLQPNKTYFKNRHVKQFKLDTSKGQKRLKKIFSIIIDEGWTISVSDAESTEILGELLNFEQGFLWTTPPDDVAKNGWIWTDIAELIQVNRAFKDRVEILDMDSKERREYLNTYNNEKMVMARVFDSEKYQKMLAAYKGVQEDLSSGLDTALLD